MSNSYGVDTIPVSARYGEYDTENGCWTGIWYYDDEDAQEAADLLEDERYAIFPLLDEDGCAL